MREDQTFDLDDCDIKFIDSFREENGGCTIPANSLVDGFITIISWMEPDGSKGWKLYHALDRPTSTVVGLLEMAKFEYLRDASEGSRGEDDESTG